MRRDRWAVIFLLAVVSVAFGQTLRNGFVNFDDDKYVCRNPHVTTGLTLGSAAWAFTADEASNWHPVTWLSHQLDCQLFGLSSSGHHLTSILLHAASAALLFLLLQRMTGEFWPSLLAAAMFAVHPLRVESVAWVAERKDVLSGLFFVLTLLAYVGYAKHPFSGRRYATVLGCFALGLMAKPMLVTLPCVLLLLDVWPLGRFATKPVAWRRLLGEKAPLFALAAASCVVTLVVQHGAIAETAPVALPWRLANAVVAYVAYLRQFLWPMDLAVLYPHPGDTLSAFQVGLAVLIFVVVFAAAWQLRRRCPWLLVGWLWYLVMLLPVIGVLQVGWQARADRYTYLPQIGLCIAIAWGVKRLVGSQPERIRIASTVAACVLSLWIAVDRRQVHSWHNSETLWNQALAYTSDNFIAHYNLGVALAGEGRTAEAESQYRKAVAVRPTYVPARFNLAVLLAHRGVWDEAIAEYYEVIRLEPDFADARNNLGSALLHRSQIEEGIAQYREALRTDPNLVDAHNNLGNALLRQGKTEEAVLEYRMALNVRPDYAEAHNNLAVGLQQLGKTDEAIEHYRTAVEQKPDYPDAWNNLGVLLDQQGKMTEAAAAFRHVLAIDPNYANARRNLPLAIQHESSLPDANAVGLGR
jgi:tetratricopeptide (TPR) repeat protein